MKAYEVKDGSWHHRLAVIGGLRSDEPGICAYINCAVGGLVMSFIRLALKAILGFGAASIIAWVAAIAFAGKYIEPNAEAFISLFVLSMVAIMLGALYLGSLLKAASTRIIQTNFCSKLISSSNQLCCTVVVNKQ
jgi:hypothetical protein